MDDDSLTLPRVTEILKPFTEYNKVPPHILKNAATRGTETHSVCAGIARGAWLPQESIKDEIKHYVNSFIQWSEAQVYEYEIIEKRFSSQKLGYTGQVDYVFKAANGQIYLADLKTSYRPQKSYPLQMAAYRRLLLEAGIEIDGALLVYLSKSGEFPEIDFIVDFEKHDRVWLSALDCHNYFNRKRLKNEAAY